MHPRQSRGLELWAAQSGLIFWPPEGGYSNRLSWSKRLSSASWFRIYSRITFSSRPTAELQCTYVYDQYTDALRLSGFLAAVPIHEIIPRDNYAVSHTRLCGGTLESKLYDTCSPKLYDIDLKIASWTSLLLLALSSSQRGGLSLLPHKSNSVSPPAKLGGFPIH